VCSSPWTRVSRVATRDAAKFFFSSLSELTSVQSFCASASATPRASIMSKRYASAQYTRVYEDPEDRKRKEFENDDSLFAGMPYAKQGMSALACCTLVLMLLARMAHHATMVDAEHSERAFFDPTRAFDKQNKKLVDMRMSADEKDEAFFQRRGVAMNPLQAGADIRGEGDRYGFDAPKNQVRARVRRRPPPPASRTRAALPSLTRRPR